MSWTPSHETTRYDRARVAWLAPLKQAVDQLGLPRIRMRKLGGLLNAIEMQIEDGGDSPVVNALLLDALRAGVCHQVDERAARGVLRAIDAFARDEARRWEQVRAGTLPPIELLPEERMGDLIEDGYKLLRAGQTAEACDLWLAAWDLVLRLARPEMRTALGFDEAYGTLYAVFNLCSDVGYELANAGLDDPAYYERLLRFTREYLALFPDEEPDRVVTFARLQGEALWALGRRSEGEAVYAALMDQFPDEGWGYIGWSDQYWLDHRAVPREYAAGEAILRRALARPELRDRKDVLERLAELYTAWTKPEEAAVAAPKTGPQPAGRPALAALPPLSAAQARKLGRNDPCWCGSGKKYKHCHLAADMKAR